MYYNISKTTYSSVHGEADEENVALFIIKTHIEMIEENILLKYPMYTFVYIQVGTGQGVGGRRISGCEQQNEL